MSDSPTEATSSSPLTAAATTNGFAPRNPQLQTQEFPLGSSPDPNDKKFSPAGTEHPVAPSSSSSTSTSFPPSISLPKRKRLTAEQIDNAEHAELLIQTRKLSVELDVAAEVGREAASVPADGAYDLHVQNPAAVSPIVRRKAVPSGEYAAQETSSTPTPPGTETSPSSSSTSSYYRRPSFPLANNTSSTSSNRPFQITSLARPVYPTIPSSSIHRPIILPQSQSQPQPPQPSTFISTTPPLAHAPTFPLPLKKHRQPSAALLQRMPSFETSLATTSSTSSIASYTSTSTTTPPPARAATYDSTLRPPDTHGNEHAEEGDGVGWLKRTITPRRLNMKKQSVENLRRLYEERVGTVGVLVEAGRWKRRAGE